MKPRKPVNHAAVRRDKEAARAAKREAKIARRIARAAEERHLGHVSEVDPTAGMLPEHADG